MNSDGSFQDKIVVITGASRGLGRCMAERFAREGANVIGCARSELDSNRIPFDYVRLDIRSSKSVEGLTRYIAEKYGKVDILINNAALPGHGGVDLIDETQWDEIFAVNLKGPVFLTQAIIPFMESGSKIIFISTGLTRKILPDKLTYSVSKAGLEMFARYTARELGSRGIRVNVVAPTILPTSFRDNDAYIKEHYEEIVSAVPLNRICSLDDVTEAVVFLCSERSDFITGVVFPVNGGENI